MSGLSDACVETILHKPLTEFDLNQSGLFQCGYPDQPGLIIDVATRIILDEVGIPLDADKRTSIEKIREY